MMFGSPTGYPTENISPAMGEQWCKRAQWEPNLLLLTFHLESKTLRSIFCLYLCIILRWIASESAASETHFPSDYSPFCLQTESVAHWDNVTPWPFHNFHVICLCAQNCLRDVMVKKKTQSKISTHHPPAPNATQPFRKHISDEKSPTLSSSCIWIAAEPKGSQRCFPRVQAAYRRHRLCSV